MISNSVKVAPIGKDQGSGSRYGRMLVQHIELLLTILILLQLSRMERYQTWPQVAELHLLLVPLLQVNLVMGPVSPG